MRHCVTCGILSALTLAFYGGTARAEGEFAQAGTFAISAERLFGLTFASVNQQLNGADVSSKQTLISLLNNGSATSDVGFDSGYATARVGADYFVIPGLSVGGSIGFFSAAASISTEMNGNSSSQDLGSGNGILLNARVGYAYMFTPKLGIWPRGGFTYMGAHAENDAGTLERGATATALTLEVPFVITPVPHLGFLIYPFWDVGLGGVRDVTTNNVTQSVDTTTSGIGIQTGLTGYF